MLDFEDDEWSTPPPTNEEGPVPVHFRLTCFRVSDVSTVDMSCFMKIGVVFYWHDPRLIGWEKFLLPPKLWGPELYLLNHNGSHEDIMEYEQFSLVDSKCGRLKRIVNYAAVVKTPMQLERFPYDIQTLTAHFVSISHWKQLCLHRYGSAPAGQIYTLSPVCMESDGAFFRLLWDGELAEFRLQRYAVALNVQHLDAGFTRTSVDISFVVSRIPTFYLFKAIVPMCILTSLTFLVHACPVFTDMSSKLSMCFTMVLAVVAQTYVMSETLPKVEVLTGIDWISFVSLFALAWLSGVTCALEKATGFLGESRVRSLNQWCCICELFAYAAVCGGIILPAWWSHWKEASEHNTFGPDDLGVPTKFGILPGRLRKSLNAPDNMSAPTKPRDQSVRNLHRDQSERNISDDCTTTLLKPHLKDSL